MDISRLSTRILFDTGQSDAFIQNAEVLDIPIAEADAVILSHGHYDHTGGLANVLAAAVNAKLYIHPEALEPKFSKKNNGAESIGMPDTALKALQHREVIWTDTPTKILSGIMVTGQVPRTNDFEDVGGAFFLDQKGTQPDTLLDDQSLFVESTQGLIVILGCTHSGVVNTLDYISQITHEHKIHAVMGGMHLLHADRRRIEKTIDILRHYNIQKVIPLHCTGPKATGRLKDAFGDKCLSLRTGEQICF